MNRWGTDVSFEIANLSGSYILSSTKKFIAKYAWTPNKDSNFSTIDVPKHIINLGAPVPKYL